MKTFWSKIAKGFTMAAIYAAGHPDTVIAIVNDIKLVAK